jgi:hypothetical protein
MMRYPNVPGVVKNRPIASRNIEKQRARRNTPFTRAARISALCHPYEYRESVELDADSCELVREVNRRMYVRLP